MFDAPPAGDGAPRNQLLLAGRWIDFRFRRGRRRTIGLKIDERGLAIAAPPRTPWREIEAFARRQESWIVRKLEQWAAAERPPRLQGHSGERLPIHGAKVTLEVRAGRRAVALEGERLVVTLRDPTRAAGVRALLVQWLKRQTMERLAPRVTHYAARIGSTVPALDVSRARKQWGVCTASGRIRLSFRLAHLAPELADYVVAHEVAHLVELNHSKSFWRLVETLYPDWRAAKHRIRLAAATLPIL